ncbi:uncharacterized protein LOC126883569 [Diabrotica virgifera virgifera]|uniref:Uncharacterized protein n=1 Tax=Diabrotica virgifera virgifera TaxID=50390 RepID=A0ABM5K4Q3_DIAVI|nr:uncharacterized protein LOC126883569 [Diabrotica virgifera virgifera]
MEGLKKTRKSLKSSITRISKWLTAKKDTENDILDFENRKEKLCNLFTQYEEIQLQIEQIDDSEQQATDRANVEEKYFNALKGLQRKIIELNSTENEARSSNNNAVSSAKLPEISIKNFTGNFSQFNEFFQLFETLILNNSSLNNIQRFIYLKSFLKGEPLNLISSLEVIDANLAIAIKTLKERYDDKSRVISTLIKKLLKSPSLVKCTPQVLRDFLVQTKQTLQALGNLEVPIEHWDSLLIEIFLEKIDFASHKAFEYEVGSRNVPTLKQFFDFLEKRCDVLEKLNYSDTQSKSNNKTTQKTAHISTINDNKSRYENCIFCKQTGHKIYQCNLFKD